MSGLRDGLYVCEVDAEEGPRQLVTVLEPEVVHRAGLIPEAIVGTLGEPGFDGAISLEEFVPNDAFVAFLHDVVGRFTPELDGARADAERTGKGWLYVIDRRTPTPDGPVPPEDILGYFAVHDGRVVPGSYRSNPNHRLLTINGFFRLEEELHRRLVSELTARVARP